MSEGAEKPRRVQLSRSKGWRMPPNTVKVARPGRFGNPFIGPSAARLYRRWLTGRLSEAQFARCETVENRHWNEKTRLRRAIRDLRGKNLACWCAPDDECHADVLLDLANR